MSFEIGPDRYVKTACPNLETVFEDIDVGDVR